MSSPRRFGELVRSSPDQFRLPHAAFLIAAAEYPELDIAAYEQTLRDWGKEAAGRAAAASSLEQRHEILNQQFFGDLGFGGNRGDYYDPDNSYLNRVMDRRTGLPITLSVLYIDLAEAAGITAAGVGFPSHFLVRLQEGERELIVDVFNGGLELDRERLLEGLREATNDRLPSYEQYLASVTKRQILQRMLYNLKSAYLQREEWAKAKRAVEFLLQLVPWDLDELRDRGLLRARTGQLAEAVADLERYLEHSPYARDRDRVAAALEDARARREQDLPES